MFHCSIHYRSKHRYSTSILWFYSAVIRQKSIQNILWLPSVPTLASSLVPLQRLLGAQTVATLFTIVDKTVREVLALHVVSHIRLGHMRKLETERAIVTASSLIWNDVFVKILWSGNLPWTKWIRWGSSQSLDMHLDMCLSRAVLVCFATPQLVHW